MDIVEATETKLVIKAPLRGYAIGKRVSIFLAGTTKNTKWRETLVDSCEELRDEVVFYDPTRQDWDSTWREHEDDARWRQQYDWEQDALRRADIKVFCFLETSDAPISLLEFGLAIPPDGVRIEDIVVCVSPDYPKAAYVRSLCQRHHISFVCHVEELHALLEPLVREYSSLVGTFALCDVRNPCEH